jgi:hypothetical protein
MNVPPSPVTFFSSFEIFHFTVSVLLF